jgi:integrase
MATITKRNGKWQARVRRKGFPTQTRTFSQKTDAQRWIRHIEIKIEKHELPPERPNYPSLRQAIERYSCEVSRFKKSHEVEKYRLAKLSELSWASRPIDQINGQHLSKLRLERMNEVSPATVRKELYLISAIFEAARKESGLNALRNPVSDIHVPSGANPKRSRIPPEKLLRVLKALSKSKHRYLPHIVTLALETGMRRGEIISLKWEQYARDEGLISLDETKNGYGRHIPLTQRAIEALEHGESQNELIFPVTANSVRLAWERMKKNNKIEGIRFHDLRHEAISRMFDSGMSAPEVASISGHKTTSMLFRYAHADTQRLREKILNFNI